ncbi:MAG: hypothetical protein E7642_00150 [Ruminococcaceae bacterium]|nr:hypothetical protein [Oscillospiraceae bacterium]
MSDKELNSAAANEQRLVVKNKKYKKNDIFAFALCLIVALIIWIHATNVQNSQMQKQDELYDALNGVSEQQKNG